MKTAGQSAADCLGQVISFELPYYEFNVWSLKSRPPPGKSSVAAGVH